MHACFQEGIPQRLSALVSCLALLHVRQCREACASVTGGDQTVLGAQRMRYAWPLWGSAG